MSESLCGHVRVTGTLPPSVGSRLFGAVQTGVDEDSDQDLWITRIDEGLLVTSYAMSEFMSGANTLAGLRHPDLVRLALVDREEVFAVAGFEALPGSLVLEDVLARAGAMPVQRALEVASKLLRGLSGLHRRSAIHGLLSPRTVVSWEGEVLLWQYGLVSHLPEQAIANRARRHGDTEMFAPELRDGQLVPPTDLFAWSVTLCQLLTGLGPSEAVGEVLDGGAVEALDARVRALLRECLHTDPLMRPNDAPGLMPRFEEAVLTETSVMTAMPMKGTPPPPPAPLDRERPPTTVSMTDGEVLELEPDESTQQGAPPRQGRIESSPRLPRRPEPTAKLSALAQGAGAGDSLSNLLSPDVGDGPAASSAPDLERLAEALADEEPGLRDLDDGGGASLELGHRDGPDDRRAGSDEGRLAPPSVALPREDAVHEPIVGRPSGRRWPARDRGPGPYGPPPGMVAGAFLIVSGALVGLSFLHVVGERGGIGGLFGDLGRAAVPDDGSQLGTGTGAATSGVGPPGEGGETEGVEERTQAGSVEAPPAACPDGMVEVNSEVCIDAAEFPGLRRIPTVSVTLREAGRSCEARGARLCALAEWRAACEGRGGTALPYGARVDHDACNTASIAGFPQEQAATGRRPSCVSAVGAYDMVGNVGEWVAEGIAAGGDSTTPAAVANCQATGRPPKGFAGENLGFRCCADR